MTDVENTAKEQTSQDDLMSELVHQSCDHALLRMKKHADKTRSSFAKMLKLKAPSGTGRLAGPAKPTK